MSELSGGFMIPLPTAMRADRTQTMGSEGAKARPRSVPVSTRCCGFVATEERVPANASEDGLVTGVEADAEAVWTVVLASEIGLDWESRCAYGQNCQMRNPPNAIPMASAVQRQRLP
jgi:hypothetical protein